jgi:hypothetical protein
MADPSATGRPLTHQRLTRRALFSLAGVAGVGLAVAACSKSGAGDKGTGAGAGGSSGTASAAPAAVTSTSPSKVPLAGGVTATVRGSGLAGVTGVLVAGIAATDVVAKADRVTFTVPHQVSYTPTTAKVVLSSGAVPAGEPSAPQPTITAPTDTPTSGTVTPETGTATGTTEGTASDPATSGTGSASGTTTVATTSLEYAALTDVDRQLEYGMRYWHEYNIAGYGNMNAIGGDCANFTSQTLIARGWKQRDDWYSREAGAEHTATWTYCPSFDPWLTENGTELGLTKRTLAERDQVKVGDIVFYDWNANGSPDHVTVVSQVSKDSSGKTIIKSVSHNDDGQYRDLDYMITVQHPGGTAWFHTFDA